jgi:phospholipid/cholesterol/gamma-HCH transport system substrate-binding protein
MNDQALRFRFGIFVLASLILLAVLTILFGGFPSVFKRTDTFFIDFENAQGISPGTPVRRSGVKIGEVRSVTLDNDTGKVRMEVRIDQQYVLHKGDRPTLEQGLLGGDASISFLPPEDKRLMDKTPVEPGAVLEGVTPAGPGALAQKAGALMTPAEEALIEIRKAFARFDRMAPTMEAALNDMREMSQMATRLGPDLQATSAEIRALSKATRESIPDIKRTNEEAQVAIRQWSKVGERTNKLLEQNEEKISRTLDRLEETLKRTNEVLSDENQKNLRETLRNVTASSRQFESITKDTGELVRESRITIRQFAETLKRADDALQDVQKTVKPLGERGPTMLKDMGEAADNLNRTLRDLRELMQVVARSEGTMQKFLNDPSLYNNLNDSAVMMTRILPRVDRVLRDAEIFADKLARHPELLGIGGVIRPSSGLKEPPFRIYP